MKTRFHILAVLLAGVFHGQAADMITSTLVITNPPLGNTNAITLSLSVRTFTNSVTASPGTLIQETNSIPWSATNILNHFTDYPVSGFHVISGGTNFFRVRGAVGEALALSVNACCFGYVTNSTQTVASPTAVVRVPMTVEFDTNRTRIASQLVQGLSDNSTNAFATNSTSGSNFLTKGASPLQVVISPLRLDGRTAVSSNFFATNGFTRNLTNINSVSSNHVNYGNAIRSEGSGGNSFQVGSNAVAIGDLSVAVGNGASAQTNDATAVGNDAIAMGYRSVALGHGAVASNQFAVAIGQASFAGRNGTALGQGAYATNEQSIAVGIAAVADGTNSIAMGAEAVAQGYQSAAFGNGAGAAHNRAWVFGELSASDSTNQFVFGTTAYSVVVPGVLKVTGTQTNTVFTGTNKFDLAISYTATNVTTLANGANDVDPGFKTYIRVSGPSAAYSIDKIDRGYNGRILVIQKTDSLTLTVPNNSGAGVLGDAAKILTGTGGTLTITNNPGFVQLIYDATASRWGVINKSN